MDQTPDGYSAFHVSTPPSLTPIGQTDLHPSITPNPSVQNIASLTPVLPLGQQQILGTPASSTISQKAGNVSFLHSFIARSSDNTNELLLSKYDAFINICKCFTGASLFVIPWAFKQSGMLLGGISLLFLSILTYFTLYWLAKCSHMHPSIPYPTYPDIAQLAFGRIGFYISWIAILCMTIGVCSSYLVFIGSQLVSLFDFSSIKYIQTYIILILSIPQILLSLFRSYRFLVPFNILGLISLILAVIVIIIESFQTLSINNDDIYYYTNPDFTNYPLFLGNAAFAFLIHSVILPIEESMKDRKKYFISSDFINSLNYSMIFVCCLFLFFGEFVYLSYGNNICGNICDNLIRNKWYNKVVIMSLCINLFFTYPLFLFPMIECLENQIFNINQQHIEIKRNILRIILVLITCFIAIIIPDFQKLTGLTGAFGNNVLGLILPPIMFMKLSKLQNINNNIKLIHKIIAYFSTIFGIVILIICTYSFIYSIITNSNNDCKNS